MNELAYTTTTTITSTHVARSAHAARDRRGEVSRLVGYADVRAQGGIKEVGAVLERLCKRVREAGIDEGAGGRGGSVGEQQARTGFCVSPVGDGRGAREYA